MGQTNSVSCIVDPTGTTVTTTLVLTTNDPSLLAVSDLWTGGTGGGPVLDFIMTLGTANPEFFVIIGMTVNTTLSSQAFSPLDGTNAATIVLQQSVASILVSGGEGNFVPSLAAFLATPYAMRVITINGIEVAFSDSADFTPTQEPTPAPTETTVCFQKGTQLLTPAGYKAVEQLQSGDALTSAKDGTTVPVKSLIQFIGKKKDGALYVLPKGVLGKNKPLNDLYMSGDHAFKAGPVWKHMKCARGGAKETDADDIEYYHIILEDYFAHTLVAEGVEVESCFEDKGDGVLMSWVCNESWCTPLKCEFKPPAPTSSGPPFTLLGNQKKKESSFMIWAYNKALKKNVPLTCTEVTLPM
jgi:hypothetical protein